MMSSVDLTFQIVCLVLHPTCAGASTVMQMDGGGGFTKYFYIKTSFSPWERENVFAICERFF